MRNATENKGEIKNATQLFGNWTFGGIKEASLNGLMNGNNLRKPWRDGFEALSSLDINNDEKISGQELSHLSLWFDKNRNGVSEKGEVRRVQEEGIVALYFRADETEAVTNNIYAYKGFDRLINGDTVSGTSVDWYASTSNNSIELALNQALYVNPVGDITIPVNNIVTEEGANNKNETNIINISGLWNWKSILDNKEQMGGVFVIRDTMQPPAYFTGQTIIEARVLDAKENEAASIAKVLSFEGIRNNKNGNLEFVVVDKEGNLIKNVATLSKDGLTMKGKSTILRGLSKEIKENYSYSWEAKRYQGKK